jgi:hypothetical protein
MFQLCCLAHLRFRGDRLLQTNTMVRNYDSVGLATTVPGPAQVIPIEMSKALPRGNFCRKRRRDEYLGEPPSNVDIRVYCLCALCAARDEPSAKLLRIVHEHLRVHPMNGKWKVNIYFLHSH